MVLARLILEQQVGVVPVYKKMPPDLDAMLAVADAAVLIGDPALRATLVDGPARGLTVVDLGGAWKEWTDLPMVFAVWAVRRAYAVARPDSLAGVRAAFRRSLAASAAHPSDVARAAAAGSDFDADQLARYFGALDFALGPRQRAGVAEFAARAAGSLGWSPPPKLSYLDA